MTTKCVCLTNPIVNHGEDTSGLCITNPIVNRVEGSARCHANRILSATRTDRNSCHKTKKIHIWGAPLRIFFWAVLFEKSVLLESCLVDCLACWEVSGHSSSNKACPQSSQGPIGSTGGPVIRFFGPPGPKFSADFLPLFHGPRGPR